MEIPFDLFDEITGAGSAAATKDSTESDRRQHRRLPFGSRGAIAPLRGDEEGLPNVVMLRDISIGGIGFLNAEPLKIGEPFVIRFSGQSGRQFKIHCAAQRCDSGGTGGTQYVIGATFEKLIDPTEALPRNPDGTFIRPEPPKPEPVAPKPPVMPARKNSLFQTPKVELAGPGPQPAPATVPAANPEANVATVATPQPTVAPAPPIGAVATPSPKIEEPMQPKADVAPIAPAETAPKIETAPVAQAPEPVVQKGEERIEPTTQPAVAAVVASEPVQPPASAHQPEAAVAVQSSTTTVTLPPAAQTAGIDPGKNQELVAQVKSRLLKQHQAMKSQVHQMEETNRQLAEQKAQIEDLGRQRDSLQAMYVKAGQQLTQEQERSAKEIEALRREVLELRETQRALHAKSESDDRAIAELAALLDSEAGVTAAGN